MKKAIICASCMIAIQLLCEFAMSRSFWHYEITEIAEFSFDLFLGVFSFWALGILILSIFYRFINPLFKNNIHGGRFVADVFLYMKMRVLFMICTVGIGFSVKILNNPAIPFPGNTNEIIQGNRHAFMNEILNVFISPNTFYITYLPVLIIFGLYIFKDKLPQKKR